jgi:threonine/homoserine/homoserine lactone efflux protein
VISGLEQSLADFLLAYLVILITPGPNALMIGSVAALRGMRGALPICLGAALGAGTLSATLYAVTEVADHTWRTGGQILASGLLLWVAVSVARLRPPDASQARPRRFQGVSAFGAGFCTAATNPLTAAFFAAQFIGPLAPLKGGLVVIPVLVVMVALSHFCCVAALLARPTFQRIALTWHRPIRLSAALILTLMAAGSFTVALSASAS